MEGIYAIGDPVRTLHASGLIYSIYGGSRIVVVRRLLFTPIVATADQHVSFILKRYSTPYTGGTQAALTAVPAGQSAAVAAHTVAPTEGTVIGAGNIRALRSFVSQAGLGSSDVVDFDLRDFPVTLVGANDGLGVVVGAANTISAAFNGLWNEF